MIYFNWSANALVPVNPGAADTYLKENRPVILKIAQFLLQHLHYIPTRVYRGIILKEPVTVVAPKKGLEYLSFSADRKVAEHFADVKGFGSDVVNVAAQLGTHGYVIEYSPKISEVLFHYHLLSRFPYAQAFNSLGIDGHQEVEFLKSQQEIMILQPQDPFTTITKQGK